MNTIVSQAMATGMPIVTTKHSGLPEQVLDGINGAVAPEGDAPALAEKIQFVMEHPELWGQYGHSGRRHAKINYDSIQLILRQIECYENLIRSSRDGIYCARSHSQAGDGAVGDFITAKKKVICAWLNRLN